jgi:hypothetical protein
MLLRKRQTPASASRFILRIVALIPRFERQVIGSQGRLAPVKEKLQRAMITAKTDEADAILEKAEEMVRQLIVADEDAKYPGLRNEEGELLVQ